MKAIDKIDISDIFNVLDHIERTPGIFLLRPNLELLYSFISGIKMTSSIKNIDMKNLDKLDEFYNFLHKKLELKNENTMGWFGVLSNKYGTEIEGFNKFYEYLNKFRKE